MQGHGSVCSVRPPLRLEVSAWITNFQWCWGVFFNFLLVKTQSNSTAIPSADFCVTLFSTVNPTLQVPSLDPILVSDPWLWLDGLQSQYNCIRFAMERGCWLRGLMVCGAWWGWGGGAIGIQKATLMSCRLTPRFDTRRALEYPMLSDVRMQLRRSRQNRTFARQGSGQNSRAHP